MTEYFTNLLLQLFNHDYYLQLAPAVIKSNANSAVNSLALRSPAADLSVIQSALKHHTDARTGQVSKRGFAAALLKANRSPGSKAEKEAAAHKLYPLFVDDASSENGATTLDIIVAMSTLCTGDLNANAHAVFSAMDFDESGTVCFIFRSFV